MPFEHAPESRPAFHTRYGGDEGAPKDHRSFDFRFDWRNPSHGGGWSTCRVSGCRTRLGRIIVLENVAWNHGLSVSGGMDDLIPALMVAMGLESFDDALWLELCKSKDGPHLYKVEDWGDGRFRSGAVGSDFPMDLLADLIDEDARLRKGELA